MIKTFKETLYADWTQEFTVDEVLHEVVIDDQQLIFFRNKNWGTVFAINGVIQTTSKDEAIYHEMMAHVPLFAHANPKNVAVIGGGDGGIIREITKHNTVQHIEMCELSGDILDLCDKFLPNHSNGSFKDHRLSIHEADGVEWLSKQDSDKYDVIISDCTDPIGPGESLFTSEFYMHAHRCLRHGGIFVAQNGVVNSQPDELKTTHRRLKHYFDNVGFYFVNVPTYIGGDLAFAYAVRGSNAIDLVSRAENWVGELKYYNKQVHLASFAMSNAVMRLLGENQI